MRRLAAVLALTLCACRGALGRGEAAFDDARYADAERDLAPIEADAKTWPDEKRATYDLYRGLVRGALGHDDAKLWLEEAERIVKANPAALTKEDHARLDSALGAMRDHR